MAAMPRWRRPRRRRRARHATLAGVRPVTRRELRRDRQLGLIEGPRPLWRWMRRVAVLAVLTLLLPVPWLHVVSEDPPGSAWRLNGRLHVDGQPIDPPGRWSWLAVGRPALVGEVLRDELLGLEPVATDMRTESVLLRPALAEPAAAAVGLRHAGRQLPMGLLVEVYGPLVEGLPQRAVLTQLEGIPLTDRDAWNRATVGIAAAQVPGAEGELAHGVDADDEPVHSSGAARDPLTFQTLQGGAFHVERQDDGLPYRVVRTLDTAPEGFDARIAFAVIDALPTQWFRELSLGSSHGLMVALTTYAHVSEVDLAAGRHIAGTGGIRGDGTVVPIGGLAAKAQAAERAGADVLFFPATQAAALGGFDPGTMDLVPVATLGEAISYLTGPTA